MNQVLQGDCLEVMRGMADCSVDAVVTDPPYGLSFMGHTWDYDVPKVEVWREVLRVLKPGGHVLSFAGSRTHHRMAVNIEDAGFDLRDTLMWVYGSGFPKSHNLDGEWDGWGSALKPAFEPITLARKPLQGTIAQNVQEWGTGGLNIDGCRVETKLLDDSRRPRNNVASTGFGGSHVEFQSGGHPAGRWPANVILSGEPEVVGCFPERTVAPSGKPSRGSPCQKGASGISFKSNNSEFIHYNDSGSAARFFKQCLDTDPEDAETRRLFYCGKATKRDRDEGLEGFEEAQATFAAGTRLKNNGDGSPRNQLPGNRNTHCTVKPTDLMRYLCRLICPPGGIILDPFTGSGSTGKAAILEGFGFIGIEQEPEYVAIANARIAAAAARSEKATLEQRVAWLETQTQALGAKVRRLEASQQLSLWGTP